MMNRGKRSLAVDLKTSDGQDILRQLSRRADVVVEQFRPGVMARLGASYDDLAMMNPRIVYCSFSGYGQTGPYKDLPGHDLNFEALAGILAVTRSGSDPRPAIRSEEHTSELQSHHDLVCRLLLEKKKSWN